MSDDKNLNEKDEAVVDSELENEIDKAADGLFKKFMSRFENEMDQRQETIKKHEKGALYGTSALNPETVKTLTKDDRAAQFIRAVAYGDRHNAMLLSGGTKIQPLAEGAGASGGFLVPEEWSSEIVQKIEEQAIIRPNATVVNLSSDLFHLPRIDTHAQAYWRGESAVKQTTTMTFTENTLTPYSLASILVASEELLADNSYNLVQIITQEMARRFADAEDNAFINGNGTGRPTGLDSYTARYTRDAGGALSGDHLYEVYHALPAGMRSRAKWIIHPNLLGLVRTLKDSNNRYLFELNGNLNGAPGSSLLGLPVLESSWVDQEKMFLVDLSYYYIGDRQSLTIDVSREATVASRSMFERNEVAFRAEERVDGELAWTGAMAEINNAR